MCALFSGLLQHCRGQRLLHRTFKERASEDPLERCSQEPAGCSGALRTSRGGQQWGREARGAGVTATRCMHADPPAVPPRVMVGTTEGTKARAKQQEGRTLCPWDPRAAAVTGWTSFRGQRPSPPASRGGCDVGMCAAPCPRPVSPGSAPQRGQGLRHRWAASLSTLEGRRSDFVVDTGVESVVAFTCIRF